MLWNSKVPDFGNFEPSPIRLFLNIYVQLSSVSACAIREGSGETLHRFKLSELELLVYVKHTKICA